MGHADKTKKKTKQEQGANSLFTDRFLCLEVNEAKQQLLNAINAWASAFGAFYHSSVIIQTKNVLTAPGVKRHL